MANVDITRVAGNIAALNALNSLQNINNQLATHQQRLSTGKQLNSASDDPAGWSMATSFDVNNNDLSTALNGIGDAKNLLATAEGGLNQISDILVKMKSKALGAVGDTVGTAERLAIGKQLDAYAQEITSITTSTQWNGNQILTQTSLSFLGGVTSSGTGDVTALAFNSKFDAATLKVDNTSISYTSGTGAGAAAGSGLDTSAHANATVSSLATAITTIKGAITDVGVMTARLTFKEENMTVAQANTSAAYNRIMNANMAQEQVDASKYQILQQTATAMLAQANSGPQFLLSLFK
jgi:flagellin